MGIQLIGQHFHLRSILAFFPLQDLLCMFVQLFYHFIKHIRCHFTLIPGSDLNAFFSASCSYLLHSTNQFLQRTNHPSCHLNNCSQHHKQHYYNDQKHHQTHFGDGTGNVIFQNFIFQVPLIFSKYIFINVLVSSGSIFNTSKNTYSFCSMQACLNTLLLQKQWRSCLVCINQKHQCTNVNFHFLFVINGAHIGNRIPLPISPIVRYRLLWKKHIFFLFKCLLINRFLNQIPVGMCGFQHFPFRTHHKNVI